MMKNRKRIFPILLVILLVLIVGIALLLSRCGNESSSQPMVSNPTSGISSTPTSSVGTSTIPGSSAAQTTPSSTPTADVPQPSSTPTQPATQATTQPATQVTTSTTAPTTVPTQPTTKPNGCSHSFTAWAYEEYTFIIPEDPNDPHDGYEDMTYTSHRKARTCTKCGYKETDGTPEHSCIKGSVNHKVTTVKEGTCMTKSIRRSTCKICGWYVEYEFDDRGRRHIWVDEKVHLSDYGAYTNELDATVSECTTCGEKSVVYHKGEGWSDYNRYYVSLGINKGNANAMMPVTDDFTLLNNPTQQTVMRNFVYDSDGYVKQYTLYWWYNGSHYSQIIKCGKGEVEAWFAEYGLIATHANSGYTMRIYATEVRPYQIGYSG